jgi:hypothetical protein
MSRINEFFKLHNFYILLPLEDIHFNNIRTLLNILYYNKLSGIKSICLQDLSENHTGEKVSWQ